MAFEERNDQKNMVQESFDRVITRALKPLLTREILFGKLQKGGLAIVTLENNELAIVVKKVFFKRRKDL